MRNKYPCILLLFLSLLSGNVLKMIFTFAFIQFVIEIFLLKVILMLLFFVFVICHLQKFVVLRIVSLKLLLLVFYLGGMVETLRLFVEIYHLSLLAMLLFVFFFMIFKLVTNTQNRVDISFMVGLRIAFDCYHGRFVPHKRLFLSFCFVLFIKVYITIFLYFLLLVFRRLVVFLPLFPFFLQSLFYELVKNLNKSNDSFLISLHNITSLDLRQILLRKSPFLNKHQKQSINSCFLTPNLLCNSFPFLVKKRKENGDNLKIPLPGLEYFNIESALLKFEHLVDRVP